MPELAIEILPVDDVVDLVNEYADATREAADEQRLAYPELHGPVSRLARHRSTTDLVAVANVLFAVFAHSEKKAVAALNASLRDTGIAPRLTVGADRATRQRWVVRPGADRLLASSALSLWQWLTQAEGRRVGTCAADRCIDVFVDHSPAGIKKYCSTTCLTRTKVAAHRARKRAGRR